MKKNKSLIVGALVMALLVVSIGYAAIASISLVISGTAKATTSSENFKVEFTGTPTVSDASKVTAKVDGTNKLLATIDVTNLSAKDDYATATYTVKNASPDLSANLATELTTNDNSEYFEVETSLSAASIGAGNTAEVTVKVKLKKTPVDEDESGQVKVTLTATPIQPN